MSNLIKYNSFVVKEEDNIVIDSNQKVIEKINSIKKNIKTSGIVQQGTPDADGFISGLNVQVVEELVAPEEEAATTEDMKAEAERILAEARAEAEEIISDAHNDAQNVINSAREQGYAEGMSKAEQDIKERIRVLEEEYASKKQILDEEYDKRVAHIEPVLVDTLLGVFSKVTHTMAEDKKDMILCLINSVMRNTDISREFLIHVSPDDYQFALNNTDKIYCSVAKDVHIEISEDTSLGRNECIIETDAGVFDCSLDIQLENLIKDIRLLSCMNN